ncbi:MAG: SRPBCC family protein [Pseudomonadales bacterium]|nr:SRPBCC family protein [Halioglobus sp.]MCP5194585.1 SRPBCC family protein [Pseudomonadales bacterium]
MSDYFECTPVGLDFLQQTKNVFRAEEVIKASPETIFEVFEDAHAWTVWAMPIQKVEWTSPKPYGVGTTRSVHMMGDMVGYEEFIAWERGKRMAFTFVGCSKDATEKFLEDYRVTDLGDGSCRVEWYMAMETRGFSRNMMWMTRPLLRFAHRRMFKKFREYTENYAMQSQNATTRS